MNCETYRLSLGTRLSLRTRKPMIALLAEHTHLMLTLRLQ